MAQPASKSTYGKSRSAGLPKGAATLDAGVRLVSAGKVKEARACFERILRSNPRNSGACHNLGSLNMITGDASTAVAMFERALAINPLDKDTVTQCCKANFMLAQALGQRHQHTQAVGCYRRVLALDPGNKGTVINLTEALANSGMRAEQSDFMADASTPLGNHALIACMPKSGSTLLFEMLHQLTGWQKSLFSYAYLQNEQELDLSSILEVAETNTVTQQHCRATEANIQIIQGLSLRPVVLVRNLADIVMSLVDFYNNGAVINTFLDTDWSRLSLDSKRDYIIDHVMPWYVGFYTSWRRAEAAGRLDCLFVHYEELIADKPGALHKIADFLGMEKTIDDCLGAITTAESASSRTRFNKGVAGRGAASLSNEQQARLKRLATPFGSIDFSPIGL
ncbi:MAG: tetratricopeptide (TPR) repeat protein [Alphaproteobacteria bacterium]|jgi:tetratricopeptide (TPR) repeat protein